MFGFFENGVEEIKRFFSPEKVGMNVSLFSLSSLYFFNRLEFSAVSQSTCGYFGVDSLTRFS